MVCSQNQDYIQAIITIITMKFHALGSTPGTGIKGILRDGVVGQGRAFIAALRTAPESGMECRNSSRAGLKKRKYPKNGTHKVCVVLSKRFPRGSEVGSGTAAYWGLREGGIGKPDWISPTPVRLADPGVRSALSP